MRVDTDTYVWDVAKIVIERTSEASGGSVTIRLAGPDDESGLAGASLYVWGSGKHGDRSMPSIVIVEDGVERVLVEGDSNPVAAARVAAVKALAVKPTERGDK
jgi:hypothetical protein